MRQGIALRDAEGLAVTVPMRRAPSNTPRLLDREVWRDAALAWLAQRALYVLIGYVGALLFKPEATPTRPYSWAQLFQGTYGWDANLYTAIARGGYAYPWSSAFYPLYPGLEHLLMGLLGGDASLAGLVIANVAALIAFGLLRALVERELGRAAAQRALLYMIVFPTSFFLIVPYTEALFLVFSLASFLALRRGRWLLAGVFAALAELTRPLGVLLLAPMLVEYLERHRRAGKPMWAIAWGGVGELAGLALGLALPVVALGGFLLSLRVGSPLAAEQAGGWARKVTLPGVGFARAGEALLHAGFSPNFAQAHVLLDGGFTLAFMALAFAMWWYRRLPAAYVAYTWATLIVVLMTPSLNWYALGSNMRFMLVVFPLFMLLGLWGKRQWVDRLTLVCSLPLLALFTLAFLSLAWVA